MGENRFMPSSTKTLNQLVRPQARFMRSIQLERDFRDTEALSGYVLTEHSREALTRIAAGLRKDSAHRAWRITGNYGAGKSSFALLLAQWFAGQNRTLPSTVRSKIPYRSITGKTPHVVPVLVTGSREPMGLAIARGLLDATERLYASGRRPTFISQLRRLVSDWESIGSRDEQVIASLIAASNRIVRDKKGSGLLLILDELGKFLEYATLRPDNQDIYILQRIAETASRSKEEPICVVALLHQGFHEYADSLSVVTQREWEKVAARFEEVLFDQPLEELAALIKAALHVRSEHVPAGLKKEASSAMKIASEKGWLGGVASNNLLEASTGIFPLHPSVLPVIARFFRRFGQNERSLFSFLLSEEPFGLRAFCERPVRGDSFFRLHHFYDYVRSNFGHLLGARSYRSHWNQIDSIIQSHVSSEPGELEILKTVGVLNLLDADDLRATDEMIVSAVGSGTHQGRRSSVTQSIKSLKSKTGVLHSRGRAGGYCLWPYTSVNLELAYERAVDAVPAQANVSTKIVSYVHSRPLVARRHYIETGNLRYFEVKYCQVSDLSKILAESKVEGDGLILIPLCETAVDREQARKIALGKERLPQAVIVAIPPPLHHLGGVIAEVERWEWVLRNTPELENDLYANEEVSRQVVSARRALEGRLSSFVGLHEFSIETSVECYCAGKTLEVKTGRDFLECLSHICDKVFQKAPKIKNELVNRRFPSSAAAAARMRLIERVLQYSSEPLLGMDKVKRPPEMSMYFSVLEAAGLHRREENTWFVCPPDAERDPCNIFPTWSYIDELLQREPDARIPVSHLMDALRQDPYGVRDGVIPILLASYVVANHDRIAMYEDGTFCPIVRGEEFVRLTKAPHTFEVQYCLADGVRSEVLRKLWKLVSDSGRDTNAVAVVDIVRPVCVFVASLPEYARSTGRLSERALAVRKVILAAHDPTRLLFYELPEACGCAPVAASGSGQCEDDNVAAFVARLQSALSELRMAYPQLCDRILQQIQVVLDASNVQSRTHADVANRASTILPSVAEPRLKAFCLRLADVKLHDSVWVESVGSFLASRPPSKWNDTDEGQFQHEIAVLGTRFMRVEGMLFEKGHAAGNTEGVRITLTRSDGRECERVVHIDRTQESMIKEMEAEIVRLVSTGDNAGLVAASQALWKVLSQEGDKDE